MRNRLWLALALVVAFTPVELWAELETGSENCGPKLSLISGMRPIQRVVITGVGAVSPLGNTAPATWDGVVNGRSGVGPITKFDPSKIKARIAAELKDFVADGERLLLDPKKLKRMDPFSQYAVVAAKEAMDNAGLKFREETIVGPTGTPMTVWVVDGEGVNPERSGTALGVGIGGLQTIQQEGPRATGKGRTSPMAIPLMLTNMAPGHVSMAYGLRGPNLCDSTACAASAHAMQRAYHLLQRGDADIMITGGSEGAITETGIAGFASMGALSTRNDDPTAASRPFDRDRDGFVMGEGAGVLVMETLESALRRGAPILAEVKGFAASADAADLTSPGNGGSRRAMELALRDARLNPEDVGYVNAHGTSTPVGDPIEAQAIHDAFGPSTAVSSTKGSTGHLLGAAGALEMVISVYTLRHGVLPPTANLENVDPQIAPLGMNLVPKTAQEKKLNAVGSFNFGFGGTNGGGILVQPPANGAMPPLRSPGS